MGEDRGLLHAVPSFNGAGDHAAVSCARVCVACADVELVLRGTLHRVLGLRRNSMRGHGGQGYGSKTWPKVVLQSSDQTDKAPNLKKNKAPFDRVFQFWILKNASKLVTQKHFFVNQNNFSETI